jgi:hypothetical protein
MYPMSRFALVVFIVQLNVIHNDSKSEKKMLKKLKPKPGAGTLKGNVLDAIEVSILVFSDTACIPVYSELLSACPCLF